MASRVGRRAALAGLAALAVPPVSARAEGRDPATLLWSGIELQGADGRTFGLRGTPRGRAPATLLHLWAHWCPACIGEMGELAAAAAALAGDGVDTVLVSHPEFWAADQAFARRRNLPFRLATPSAANAPGVLDAALLEGNGAYLVPRSMLFGAAGRGAVWSHEGALPWSSPTVVARLRAALAG